MVSSTLWSTSVACTGHHGSLPLLGLQLPLLKGQEPVLELLVHTVPLLGTFLLACEPLLFVCVYLALASDILCVPGPQVYRPLLSYPDQPVHQLGPVLGPLLPESAHTQGPN